MNKSQTVRANSIIRQLSEKYPEKKIRLNPNIVTNSLGGKMITIIIQDVHGTLKYAQANLNFTIQKNLQTITAKI